MLKKILLVLEGRVAEDFLRNLLIRSNPHNSYITVSNEKSIITLLRHQEEFEFHCFDPTSAFKLIPLLSKEILDAFIILENKKEGKEVYRLLRHYSQRMSIILLGEHQQNNDANLTIITETPLVAAHFIERVPNIPMIAKDIGLGDGEIMQVNIPFGSSFAYRSIGSILQNNWKIVSVYRDGKMMLAKYSLILKPNDALLMVGEPEVLLEIHRSINEELGQFPFPFGKNLVLYCDCHYENENEVDISIQESLYIHKNFKGKKLYIRIIHPQNPTRIESIRKLEKDDIDVTVQYHSMPLNKIIESDKNTLSSGLVIIKNHLFMQTRIRKTINRLNIPVLSLGNGDIQHLKGCSVLLGDNTQEGEKISSIAFDVASQLRQPLILYDFAPDLHYHIQSIEHYESMAKVFNSKLEVITTDMENPILWLMRHPDILGIFPFTRDMAKRHFFTPLTTNLNKLSLHLITSHKLYIPITK